MIVTIKTRRITTHKPNKEGAADLDVAALATLFTVSQLDLKPRTSPTQRQRVADALSELLCNPETPNDLFEAAAQYVCDSMNGSEGVYRAIYYQPDILRKLIDYRIDSMGDRCVRDRQGAEGESKRVN